MGENWIAGPGDQDRRARWVTYFLTKRAAAQTMLGAIAGDVIGSIHEGAATKTKQFPLFGPHNSFTDDTVLTVAVAESLLSGTNLVDLLQDYFRRYPQAGYGGAFIQWAKHRRREPYNMGQRVGDACQPGWMGL